MFDWVKCEYSFPDPEFQNDEFQTKELDNFLDNYRIDAEGYLWRHDFHIEPVPEAELPEGFSELSPFLQYGASTRRIEDGDTRLDDMHGDIHISASRGEGQDWQYYQWRVRFTHGKVEGITPVDSPALRTAAEATIRRIRDGEG